MMLTSEVVANIWIHYGKLYKLSLYNSSNTLSLAKQGNYIPSEAGKSNAPLLAIHRAPISNRITYQTFLATEAASAFNVCWVS
ncbi:MAG: hypothetical protein MI924_02690 [Chloroflexales bacterium]|nr:hypothetical protein [Chloroflexales bacterium]